MTLFKFYIMLQIACNGGFLVVVAIEYVMGRMK